MIEPDEVRRIAEGARIQLNDDEIEHHATQLTKILSHFRKLGELDTDSTPAFLPALPGDAKLREDQPQAGLSIAQSLANAASTDGPFIRVPKTR